MLGLCEWPDDQWGITFHEVGYRCYCTPRQSLKAQGKEMKEEREALIRENEERMARRKAYIRSLEQEIGRCEVRESERWSSTR